MNLINIESSRIVQEITKTPMTFPILMVQNDSSDLSRTGRVNSLETFASVDGPGVRFAIFLQGCRMRCKYCHNPNTWAIDSGDEMTVGEILDRAENYRPYWGKHGGITVSGGEPLLQIDFLISLFREAKRRNIGTCIDTSVQPFKDDPSYLETFDLLMSYTDILLVDIKHIDPDAHKELTGWDNSNIMRCLRHLSDIGKPVWIRYVLVPGHTDDIEDLKHTREFLDTLSNIEKVDILPYHTLGVHKYESLGLEYRLQGVEPPTSDEIRTASSILKGV